MSNFQPASYYLGLLNEVQKNNDFESLTVIDTETTVAYGYMNTVMGDLEANRALFEEKLTETGEKYTNAAMERAWNITEQGQTQIKLKRDLKTMEAILKNVKNKLISLSIEQRETR